MMYLLVAAMFNNISGLPVQYNQLRWTMASKATCEAKRDALLAQWSPVGKPSGLLTYPYLTDAWCFEKRQFDKENNR